MGKGSNLSLTSDKRVLIISHALSLAGGFAAHRLITFVRHLRDLGWTPIVLAATERSSDVAHSDSLYGLPSDVEVVQVPYPIFSPIKIRNHVLEESKSESKSRGRHLRHRAPRTALLARLKPRALRLRERIFVPDVHVLWALQAARTGREIIRHRGVACVFTMSGSNSMHLAGVRLQRTTGVKWIADFDRPWTDGVNRACPRQLQKLDKRIEKLVFREASHIVTVTDGFARQFEKRHPNVRRKLTVIRNGWDAMDFPLPVGETQARGKVTPCHIVCADIPTESRGIERFLQALHLVFRRQMLIPSQVLVDLCGGYSNNERTTYEGLVSELKLNKVVRFVGDILLQQVMEKLQKADALLLIGNSGRRAAHYVPDCLYAYLAAGRPILGVLDEGEAADLVREAHAGAIVNQDDVYEVARAITDIVQKRNTTPPLHPNWRVISTHSRISQTECLAKLFDDITELGSQHNQKVGALPDAEPSAEPTGETTVQSDGESASRTRVIQ